MGVTIYYCLCALFKTEALNLIFYFSLFLFFFYLDDQRSLQPGFLLYLFLVFVKFYWKNHCLCFFWQLSALTCSYTHFVPLLKKIKKIKVHNVSFLCPHLTHSVNYFQENNKF